MTTNEVPGQNEKPRRQILKLTPRVYVNMSEIHCISRFLHNI